MTVPATPTHIDAALRDAQVLAHEYDTYDTDAALDRLGPDAVPGAAPRTTLTRTEQAVRDLDLAATLIVDAPGAATSLGRLLDHDRIDPGGAVVFAALLHLAGHPEGAQFWWQFAAGSGNANAAFCLFLLHEQRADFRDARYWRAQSAALSAPGTPRRSTGLWCLRRWSGPPQTAASVPHHLLPDSIRHDLLSRCRQGDRPTLPNRVQALIHSLPVERDDDLFGEIPQPDRSLSALQQQSAPRPWRSAGTAGRGYRTVGGRYS
ncbi:glycoprotein [Streptomyces sp. NPDC005955]|uniref:glycoprotein n=1 Tax=Streptomyces sp. NPDC005955 TaxID=3364738 RepID=UPI0036932926